MPDARFVRDWDEHLVTAGAAVGGGELWQLSDGAAAFYDASAAASSGDKILFQRSGEVTLTKTSGVVLLDGGRVYWDHSANSCTYRKNGDRDFYVGRAVGDAQSSDVTCVVRLNADPRYDRDLARDGFQSVLVGTPAAGGFGYPVNLGGALIFELSATNEPQKVDALGVDDWVAGTGAANAIIEGAFRVLSNGGAGSQDISIGIANATHANDADNIAESVFIHLNGDDLNIYAESDDGTTEVAATDTTVDYVEGSTLASRNEFWIDMRNPADCQIYVNGSLVLGSTVFDVDAAAGPWFLLVHVEKATGTDTFKLAIDWLRARFAEQ